MKQKETLWQSLFLFWQNKFHSFEERREKASHNRRDEKYRHHAEVRQLSRLGIELHYSINLSVRWTSSGKLSYFKQESFYVFKNKSFQVFFAV